MAVLRRYSGGRPLSKLYIGIDPGESGGIAGLNGEGRVVLIEAMPPTDADILRVLRVMLASVHDPDAFAVVERVGASPQMGVSSAFKFGGSARAVRMALTAVGIPYDQVLPTKWQTLLSCRTGGGELGKRSATEAKNITKRRAQELWPERRITHNVADALLLAEYCRRVRSVGTLHNETRPVDESQK